MALKVNILFPCNPKGESKLIPAPMIENTRKLADFMGKNTREIVAAIDQITGGGALALLDNIKQWELEQPKKEQRPMLLRSVQTRMNHLNGLTKVRSQPSMIIDDDGNLVPDRIVIT